ncbi:prephenate dehydrogenase/arogenate dehydrogenase family protein [Venenivibrio stagnispumantis]|uniref:prephenate dehydrogenase n=1 Tax=Venenivibrio stagnispumantis TaxID=407998 RepID=A0AA45WJI7_9AQUI|nr:prephenate dehydrogenase/arogenate dehydrogenase family protein [Venenivibrio stagnispumantis]MCW4572426.1 prephenate dehydrogenase/arogenate dehydrogenase family protein [Venenivibrio stagnispumantis]SMP03318.1 prephenate dehydrogenase/prephenate dehydrogenase [Venenivibrio stagnispumantis]
MKDFGNFKNVLIIGLGLIGGSLALSLKNEGFKGKIYGFDLNKERIKKASELNAIDEGFDKFEDINWQDIDLVILATPVKTFENIAKQIKPFLNKDTIISDVGSVKGELVLKISKILQPNIFLGVHPIAGTEKEGIENAVIGLFKGARLIITPSENINQDILKRIEKFWKDLGSKVEIMEPYLHDFVFASVSHLPHAVAFALVDALINLSKETGIDLFKYPGGGFKDFTRIAASSPTVWKDIFLENKKDVLHTIDEFIKSMNKLKEAIEKEDEDKILNILSESREKRLSLEKS